MFLLLTTLACSTPEPDPAPAPTPTPEAGGAETPDAPPSPEAVEGPSGEDPRPGAGEVPGEGITFSGTIEGFGDGQVRFVENGKNIHIAEVKDGAFSIEAPAGNPNPVNVLVTAPDGSWAALPDTVTLGSEDVSITFSSTDQPEWAANTQPPPSQTMTENDLDRDPAPTD